MVRIAFKDTSARMSRKVVIDDTCCKINRIDLKATKDMIVGLQQDTFVPRSDVIFH